MKSKEDLIIKLGEIAADLSSIRDLKALEKTVAKTVNSIVDVKYWGMYFYDESTNNFYMLSAKGFSIEERDEAEKTAIDRHPGWVFESKKMLYIKDTLTDNSGNSLDSKRGFEVRSRLWLPIISNDKALGAFGFASIYPKYFNKEHISTLSFVCNLAGVVYNNIKLIESKKEQTIELIKANKNLLEINDSLDSFAYKITHDLRSPATNVKGLINVLNHKLKEIESDVYKEEIKLLDISIDILLEKLESFVELLKLESSNKQMEEECNLSDIILGTINNFTQELNSTGGIIEIDIPNSSYKLTTIKEYLKSIFFNLIQNAIKYKSTERKLIINVKLEKLKNHFKITISDNGEGIDNQYFNKLFTMFTRFSRNSTVGGSGIGLYIVKKQIDTIKGEITIKSKVGKGTTFSIILPKTI